MNLALAVPYGVHPQIAAFLRAPKPAGNKPVKARVWFKAPGKANRHRRRNYFRRIKFA